MSQNKELSYKQIVLGLAAGYIIGLLIFAILFIFLLWADGTLKIW